MRVDASGTVIRVPDSARSSSRRAATLASSAGSGTTCSTGPEAGDRHCGEPVAEGQRLVSREQHGSRLEALSEPVAEKSQTPEVGLAYGCRRLDFDGDQLAAVPLQHDIGFPLGLVAVVMEVDLMLGPLAVADELHGDERLEEHARQVAAEIGGQPVLVRPGQVREQPGIGHVRLGRLDLTLTQIRVPGRKLMNEVELRQKVAVVLGCLLIEADVVRRCVEVRELRRSAREQAQELVDRLRVLDTRDRREIAAEHRGDVAGEEAAAGPRRAVDDLGVAAGDDLPRVGGAPAIDTGDAGELAGEQTIDEVLATPDELSLRERPERQIDHPARQRIVNGSQCEQVRRACHEELTTRVVGVHPLLHGEQQIGRALDLVDDGRARYARDEASWVLDGGPARRLVVEVELVGGELAASEDAGERALTDLPRSQDRDAAAFAESFGDDRPQVPVEQASGHASTVSAGQDRFGIAGWPFRNFYRADSEFLSGRFGALPCCDSARRLPVRKSSSLIVRSASRLIVWRAPAAVSRHHAIANR